MWHYFKPKNAVWYCWRLNGAAAYLRKDREAWRIAFRTIPFGDRDDVFGGPETEAPPETLPIIHAWGSGESVFLHPYLSGRPYVLRLRERLRVAPGRQCRFTVALPPLLRFELAPENVLAEEMPFLMSKTFSGPDLMSGEICHSLPLVFACDLAAQTTHHLTATMTVPLATPAVPSAFVFCDVVVKNNTRTALEPERIIVHPEPLSVYVHRDRLVTDTLELDYSETDCKPRVNHFGNAGYRLVSAGVRYRAGENFARRSADIIKDITTI